MKEKHDNVILKNYQNIKIVTLEKKHVLPASQLAAAKIGIDPIICKINKVFSPLQTQFPYRTILWQKKVNQYYFQRKKTQNQFKKSVGINTFAVEVYIQY